MGINTIIALSALDASGELDTRLKEIGATKDKTEL